MPSLLPGAGGQEARSSRDHCRSLCHGKGRASSVTAPERWQCVSEGGTWCTMVVLAWRWTPCCLHALGHQLSLGLPALHCAENYACSTSDGTVLRMFLAGPQVSSAAELVVGTAVVLSYPDIFGDTSEPCSARPPAATCHQAALLSGKAACARVCEIRLLQRVSGQQPR